HISGIALRAKLVRANGGKFQKRFLISIDLTNSFSKHFTPDFSSKSDTSNNIFAEKGVIKQNQ
ncbi:MAG TPA: hypothetical protein VJ894_08345, partial [Cryomorphaceae bacterium]|nr:hypothetical protein [Cryomorphaceae bacterium]